jgi:hypothetical protein
LQSWELEKTLQDGCRIEKMLKKKQSHLLKKQIQIYEAILLVTPILNFDFSSLANTTVIILYIQ